MGTSMNQRSPRTTNWRAVEAVYSNPKISIQRIVQEVWRASVNDDSGLANTLGKPIVSRSIDILQIAKSSSEAAEKIRREVALSGDSSLAGDIAQRAAVIAFGEDNKIQSFIRTVFTEASNYLVSRDIPGYVGLTDRLRTVQDVASLKTAILSEVAAKVDSIPQPARNLNDPVTWNSYVTDVVNILTRDK